MGQANFPAGLYGHGAIYVIDPGDANRRSVEDVEIFHCPGLAVYVSKNDGIFVSISVPVEVVWEEEPMTAILGMKSYLAK